MSDGRGVRKTVHTTLLEPSETISLGRSHLATWQSETFLCYSKKVTDTKEISVTRLDDFFPIGLLFKEFGDNIFAWATCCFGLP